MFANLLWSHCQSECKITAKNKIPHEVRLLDCDLMWKRFVLPDCPVNSREKGEHLSYSRAAHVPAGGRNRSPRTSTRQLAASSVCACTASCRRVGKAQRAHHSSRDSTHARWMVRHAALCPAATRVPAYAARTLTRNSSTALRSMPDWVSSSRAFASTSDAALPVAAAAVVTPPIWVEISFDPAATD